MSLHELCKSGFAGNIEAYLNEVATQTPDDLSYVVDLRNDQRYTPLHCAIFARNYGAVKALLAGGADVDLKCHGTPPIHLAVASSIQPLGETFGLDCLTLLLESKANIAAKDDHGHSVSHLASEYNLPTHLEVILKHALDVDDMVNGGPKLTGVTPLHRAARTDAHLAATVLLANGAHMKEKCAGLGVTALHIAAATGSANVWRVLVKAAGQEAAKHLQEKDSLGRTPVQLAERSGWSVDAKDHSRLVANAGTSGRATAIVANPLCSRHFTCPPSQVETPSAPPENTKRLHVLIDEHAGVLRAADLSANLQWVENGKSAALVDVLRVHEWAYVRKVQEHCAGIASDDPEDEEEGYAHLDGDTAISSDTYNAALAAAGAVCQAVDLVAGNQARNAFCPVRPPGHHAGPKGVVKGKDGGPDSHGFCILNNVSIGASYAMNMHRDTVKKVAIVDFDVHHGNGTEETVRWLRPSVETFPIGNSTSDVFGVMHLPQYKPWYSERDPSNVLFVSVHGYGPRERGLEHMLPMAAFYPGSGKTTLPTIVPTAASNGATTAGASGAAQQPRPATSFTAKNVKGKETKEVQDVDDQHDDSGSDGDSDGNDDGGMDFEGSDQDGDGSDKGEEEEDDSMLDRMRELQRANAEGGGGAYGKVLRARNMYSSFAPPHGSMTGSGAGASKSDNSAMPALILDIGVQLPGAGGDGAADRGKALAELSYRIQWRKYFRDEIFPRLMDFKPDFLFISAGFDAHKKDTINSGYIALVEEDFAWVTEKLVQITNSCCDGRVVSVLEGGYQLGGEHCSAFAQSAKAHVRSLCAGTKSKTPFSVAETQAETALELQHMEVLEELRQAQLLRKEQAREQAYLARMARELELQREREQQQTERVEEENSSAAASGVVVVAEAASPVQGDKEGGRKRRRQQVDYVALDKELRDGKQEHA